MKRLVLLLALVPAVAAAGEPPSEAQKIAALKLAYALNGCSMVRSPMLGAIDVSHLLNEETPPPPPPTAGGVRTIPINPNKKDR